MIAPVRLWKTVWISSAASRAIGNAQARAIGNAGPVLSGTLAPRNPRVSNAESAPSNYPNIKILTCFLAREVCGYRAEAGFREPGRGFAKPPNTSAQSAFSPSGIGVGSPHRFAPKVETGFPLIGERRGRVDGRGAP